MAAKLIGLTHKIAIQLQVMAGSSTICSSRSRRPIQKLLVTPSYWFCWKVVDSVWQERVIRNYFEARRP